MHDVHVVATDPAVLLLLTCMLATPEPPIHVADLIADFLALANAHSHQGCGHRFVANEAKQWSDLYAQQYSQQRASNVSSTSIKNVVRKLLQAAPKVPIRIWVEYQGTEELSAAGQQRLREVVSKAVAVLQKFYKVR